MGETAVRRSTSVTVALLLTTFLLGGALHAQDTAAKWIWYPESASTDCIKQKRWFLKSFELPAAPTAAELWLLADDHQSLWVNGRRIETSAEARGSSQRYDLRDALRAGDNVLAIEGYNAIGLAGIIARLTVQMPNATHTTVSSDASWLASKVQQEGWNLPGFDATGWVTARAVGSAFARPWRDILSFHTDVFISDAERAAYDRWLDTIIAPPERFADEPSARAELKQFNGAPALFINGSPRPCIMYRGTVDPLSEHGRRQLTNFRDAGVHVFAPYAQIGKLWPEEGKYDFSTLDHLLRAYLSADPNAYLILMIRLIPPNWWMAQHPDEWVEYGVPGELQGNEELRRARRASMASEAWLRDTCEAWRALIHHVESQPWGKRVIGYHPAYGISAEWHYFGSWTDQYPDTGQAMTRRFRGWLRDKYQTLADLRRAWQDPEITFDTATVPGVDPRKFATYTSFRDAAAERPVIDYYHCHQAVIADDIDALGRVVKQETEGRALCGVYYGYFFGVRPQTQGGHLELERLFKSPNIDYFVAPYSYADRLMGDDGRLRSLAAAFNHAGKTHIIEADIRTYLHSRNEYGRTENVTESLAAIGREFSTALIEHTGYWYVDFGPDMAGGWFDDPAIMAQARDLYGLAERAMQEPRKPAAEIALVCDLESGYALGDGDGMRIAHDMISRVGSELHRVGAPFDAILLPQLLEADLSRYRMLVFLNTFSMTDEQATFIKSLREDGEHALVFLWAPGLVGPDTTSVERVSRITGMKLSLLDRWLPATVTVTEPDDPLVAGIPGREVVSIKPEHAIPVPGFSDTSLWLNPRTDEMMQRDYRAFDVSTLDTGVRWTFDTSYRWTDVHFNAPVPEAGGIGFDLRLEGDCSPLSLRFVVKDANWAEFVAPAEVLVAGGSRRLNYSLSGFDNAPWSKKKPDTMALPLRGMKFVIDNTANVGQCSLSLTNLESLDGEETRERAPRYGTESFRPALVPAADGLRVLGRIQGTDLPALVATGQGLGTTVFSCVPFIPREVFAALMKQAGVHQYVDVRGDVLRADSRFLAIHTKPGGARTLKLPTVSVVRDALTGKTLGRGRAVPILLPPTSTTILELSPATP